MAVPGTPGWQSQILGGINAPTNPQTLRLLDAWQRAEGGSAANNPFNTTLAVPGATPYNSVGVRNYQTPQQGIQATLQTLQNPRYASGYQPIIQALRQGNQQAFVSALGASPWGTSASLVGQILGSPGAPGPTPAPPGGTLSGAPPPGGPLAAPKASAPGFNPMPLSILSGLQSGNLLGGVMSGSLLGSLGGVPASGAPSPVAPLGGAPTGPMPTFGTVKTGDPVPLKFQTSIGGEHPTEGLDGFPAHDFMAPAGSPTVAPVTGKIVKLSGHDPADGPVEGAHGPFGWSVYIAGADGRTYYMTHLGSRNVRVGQTVRAGQRIGTVGDYAKWTNTPDHIHMGVSAPGVTVS